MIELLVEHQLGAGCLPAGRAAEIAVAVQRQHGGLVEGRGVVGRGRVRHVMFHQHHLGAREPIPKLQVEGPFRPLGVGPDDGHAVDFASPHARDAETFRDGVDGQFRGLKSPRHLLLFDRGDQFAVFQNGASSVVEQTADPENDHPFSFSVFSILAQVSRSATVRLKTGLAGVESKSTQK